MSKEIVPYELPENWVWTTLGELGIIVSGGTPSTNEVRFWSEDIPWITPADLSGHDSKYISKGRRNISAIGLEYSSAVLLPERSLLFSSRAPIGYTVIAQNELATNQGFKNLIVTKSSYEVYLYYYLQSAKQEAIKRASGTTFLELSAKGFSEIPVPLPPLEEQYLIVEKIEELFSELEHAEKTLTKVLSKLSIYQQVILNEAYSGKLTKDWRKDKELEAASKLLVRFKQKRVLDYEKQISQWQADAGEWKIRQDGKRPSRPTLPQEHLTLSKAEFEKLNKIPKTWSWDRIGNIAFVTKLAGYEYSKYVTYSDEGEIPVIKAQNVSKNGFKEAEFSYVTNETLEMLPRIRLIGGEILFVFIGAGIGNVGIVPFNRKFLLGPNVAMIKLSEGIFNKYIEYFLTSSIGKKHIANLTKATAQGSISMESIRKIVVPVAPYEEQKQIVEDLEYKSTIIENLKKTIKVNQNTISVFRKKILNNAHRGLLIEPLKNVEHAKTLLERIKQEKAEYLVNRKIQSKTKTKRVKIMEDKRSVMQILKDATEPMPAWRVWQESIHKDDIEAFYAELKKMEEQIEVVIKGQESSITLIK